MKVTNNFNNNFGALLGKKEVVTRYYKDRGIKIHTFQHVYPFKDEFKSKEEMQNWLKDIKQSSFYKSQDNSSCGVVKEATIILEPELPFTREIFEKAKKDGVELIPNPEEFYSVVETYEGYYPAYTFEDGKFNCII